MTKNFLSMGFVDASNEPASLRWFLNPAVTGPQVTALIAATDTLSNMLIRDYIQGVLVPLSSAAGTGYREMKFLARCHDGVNQQKWSYSIPGAIATATFLPGTDFVDPASADYIALKTAVEACVVTPWFDNNVILDSLERTRGKK